MRRVTTLGILVTCVCFGAQSNFDPDQKTWTLSNSWLNTVFELTSDGHFVTLSLSDVQTGARWIPADNQPSTPIRLKAGSEVFDVQRQYELIAQSVQALSPAGIRQTIVLRDLKGVGQVTLALELYDNQPVLHYSLTYRNL